MKALLCLAALALMACAQAPEPKPAPASVPPGASVESPASAIPPATSTPRADLSITATEIRMRDVEGAIVTLVEPRASGIAAEHKRNGPNDLYIVPLAEKARPSVGPYVIDVDPRTPYRIVIEVLFTLGQREIGTWTLRSSASPERSLTARAPARGSRTGLALSAFVVTTGISLKASGGNVAPGCSDVGAGITIPKRDGVHDLASFASCLAKLKAEFPDERTYVLTTNPDTDFETVLSVVEAARGSDGKLFTEVMFAVSR